MRVQWFEHVDSTQDTARGLLIAAGSDQAPLEPPFAVATDDQRGGRGRLGRVWTSPAGQSLALTVVHRPVAPIAARTWYPLVVGLGALGVLSALPSERALPSESASAGADGGDAARLGLKWPNDLLDAQGRKAGGILVEATAQTPRAKGGSGAGGELCAGIGINLHGPVRDAEGRPVPRAVALDDLGLVVPEARVLAAELAARIGHELELLDAAGGDALASGQHVRYCESCITTDQAVRVEPVGARPGADLQGWATGIDALGRLLVREASGHEVAVDVGDVHHVRAADAESR